MTPLLLTLLSIGAISGVSLSCARELKFPELGTELAGPGALDKAPSGLYFYILNTDFERRFNTGSVLVLKEDGTKVGAVNVPRLGRSLTVAGTRMIATFDAQSETEKPHVQILDLSNEESPVVKADLEIDCTPINAVALAQYEYFAITCTGGDLWIGTFASDLAASTITRVRSYGRTRRAMYIDPVRKLLLAFPTDTGRQDAKDEKFEDAESANALYEKTPGANDVPDKFEKDRRAFRESRGRRGSFQAAVYNIGEQAKLGFPYLAYDNIKDQTAAKELRWLYFSLSSPEGWPDDKEGGILNGQVKNYRTNFWAARPDPRDPNAFYVSQRGHGEANNANNIVRVSIIGDLTNQALPTAEVLSFERVYGFGGEVTDRSFPSDFDLVDVQGQQLMVINHFRDLVYWKAEDRRFAIEAKTLDGGFWLAKNFESTDHRRSYYQIAVNSRGRGLTLSYYSNTAFLIDVLPGRDIVEIADIQ